MSPGLPHLPAPEDPERVAEKRCAGCGAWSHPAESRCQRCGRKLEALLGAESRRELEETESLPGPAVAVLAAPKPSPEPEWKEELSRRLAGYRERQAAQGERFEEEETQPVEADSSAARLPFGKDERLTLPPPRSDAKPSALPPVRIQDQEAEQDSGKVERIPRPDYGSPPIFDRMMAAQSQPRPTRPRVEDLLAPVATRFMAGLFDLCVVALALGVFVAVTHLTSPDILKSPSGLGVVGGAFVVLLLLYWAAYLRLMGSTAGMHWTGLRVLNLDGEPPDVRQRWTRAFGTVLSAAALGLGFLWSVFDDQHFTWHDRLSKTFVAVDS